MESVWVQNRHELLNRTIRKLRGKNQLFNVYMRLITIVDYFMEV